MDLHKSTSPSVHEMEKTSTTNRNKNNKNNMMLDIELAEPKDEFTTISTEQQQQHKKKKQCTTIKALKNLHSCYYSISPSWGPFSSGKPTR
jgi:hypothetical protein